MSLKYRSASKKTQPKKEWPMSEVKADIRPESDEKKAATELQKKLETLIEKIKEFKFEVVETKGITAVAVDFDGTLTTSGGDLIVDNTPDWPIYMYKVDINAVKCVFSCIVGEGFLVVNASKRVEASTEDKVNNWQRRDMEEALETVFGSERLFLASSDTQAIHKEIKEQEQVDSASKYNLLCAIKQFVIKKTGLSDNRILLIDNLEALVYEAEFLGHGAILAIGDYGFLSELLCCLFPRRTTEELIALIEKYASPEDEEMLTSLQEDIKVFKEAQNKLLTSRRKIIVDSEYKITETPEISMSACRTLLKNFYASNNQSKDAELIGNFLKNEMLKKCLEWSELIKKLVNVKYWPSNFSIKKLLYLCQLAENCGMQNSKLSHEFKLYFKQLEERISAIIQSKMAIKLSHVQAECHTKILAIAKGYESSGNTHKADLIKSSLSNKPKVYAYFLDKSAKVLFNATKTMYLCLEDAYMNCPVIEIGGKLRSVKQVIEMDDVPSTLAQHGTFSTSVIPTPIISVNSVVSNIPTSSV